MKTTRAWAVIIVLAAAWAAAGPFLERDGAVLEALARWGEIAAALAPALFICVYTVLGLMGAAKWWRTDIGVTLALFAAAAVAQNGILGWVFAFQHGRLTSPPEAWAYEGGVIASSLIIFWRTVIWIRIHRRSRADARHTRPKGDST